jgi:hypothetical protein
MLKYVNETEYVKLLGKSIPSDFNNKAIEASSYINYVTHNRISPSNPNEKVKYVTCLIIDLINEEKTKISEIGNLTSQNIEGWSESYRQPEEVQKEYDFKKYDVLKQFLWNEIGTDGKPLLYCGVC